MERWPIKIAADDDRGLVDTVAQQVTIAELAAIPRPEQFTNPRRRAQPVETKTFLLRGRLVGVSAQDDGDLHVVLRDLFEDNLTLVAEIPAGYCTADPEMAKRFDDARQALRGTARGAVVEITGIGFWDTLHGQSGMAPNGLEIHPVLTLKVIR